MYCCREQLESYTIPVLKEFLASVGQKVSGACWECVFGAAPTTSFNDVRRWCYAVRAAGKKSDLVDRINAHFKL